MNAGATRRAVHEALARGLSTEHSDARAVELGQHLQSAVTSDLGAGVSPAEVLAALQEEARDPRCYAALLELLVIASLDELTVLVDLPSSDIGPVRDDRSTSQPSSVPRRRRR